MTNKPTSLNSLYQKRVALLAHFYGPPGTGKTMFAASVSKHWNKNWLTMPSANVPLDDCLFVSFDSGGLESLSAEGIQVPSLDFDNFLIAAEGNVVEALLSMHQEILKIYDENDSIEWIIFDTLTSLDKHLNSHYKKVLDEETQKGYRYIGNAWRDWHLRNKLIKPKGGLVYLSHSKFLDENRRKKDGSLADPSVKKKAKAQRSDVGVEIFPDITGSSKDMIKADESIRGICRKKWDDEGVASFEQHFTSEDGFEGKSRYRKIPPVNTSLTFRELLKLENYVSD